MEVHTIVTHVMPHLDEIAAIWLWILFHHGEETFELIERGELRLRDVVRLVFVTERTDGFDSRTPEECEQNGIFLVGVGGGRFDEHPNGDEGRKENECATTLVAKALGLDEDPTLWYILDYVRRTDLKGGRQPLDLISLVEKRNRRRPGDPEKVIERTIEDLEDVRFQQIGFMASVKENIETEIFKTRNGREVKLAVIRSDSVEASRYARSKSGGGADITIQLRSSGNVQICLNQKGGRGIANSLDDLTVRVRLEEQKIQGVVTENRRHILVGEKVEGLKEWYYHPSKVLLLNGSETAPNVPPTRIPLERLIELVKTAFYGGAEVKHHPGQRTPAMLQKGKHRR